MATPKQLRIRGFTVQPATDAVGCTEVISDTPFYYCNSRAFERSNTILMSMISPANVHGDKYRLLIGGQYYLDDQEVPYAIFSADDHQFLLSLYDSQQAAIQLAQHFEKALERQIRKLAQK